MTTQTAIPADASAPRTDSNHLAEPVRSNRGPSRRKNSGLLKFLVFVVIVAAATGGAYKVFGKEKFMKGVEFLKEQVVGAPEGPPDPPFKSETSTKPWDGLVRLTDEELETIGCKIFTVEPQTKPISLELPGQTDYDLNTLNKVRPRFDNALVEKVYVSMGQAVKKGQPILEVRSAELGAAKNDCRTKYVQWDHDHKYLVAREPLAKDGRITQIMWTDTINDEKKSRLDYMVSREKLATYGMANPQIDHLLEGLGDDRQKALEANNDTQDITRMTVVSPIDGVVVERDVVPGNFYDQVNIMLTISPMDELWVWGNVSENDLSKVHLGQTWEVMINSTKGTFQGKVESIANGVDPDTRTLKIRASIPNPDKSLYKGMLARAYLKIPPVPGDTVIPRNALVVINGDYYAFVAKGKEPGKLDATGKEEKPVDLFERRKLDIEQENTDFVIVKKGLKEGERVVSNGALLLGQKFEDLSTVDTGSPAQ
jgi:cobalt-zinc-cadmium efflux system membrane fusion protein